MTSNEWLDVPFSDWLLVIFSNCGLFLGWILNSRRKLG